MKLIFKKGIAPQFDGDLTKLLRDYDVEQRSEHLLNIENILRKADASFDNSINKGQELFWNFQTSENSITARRFQKFLPMVFRSRKTDFFLYEYQNKGVEWLRANKQGILADDMGLGKSLQVLKACELEIFNNKVPTVFIFCPNSLVKNWVSELDNWFPLANYAELSKLDTKNQLSNFTFLITPYSQIENFVKKLDGLIPKESISIFDEAHKLRNDTAKVSRFSRYIKSGHKWLLTGTPLERDTKDIDTILKILNPGLAVNKLTNDTFLLKSRFKNITLRRTKLDVLKDLPQVSRKIHYVELSENQKDIYNSILEKYKKTDRKEKIGILTELMITATIGQDDSSSKISKALEICKAEAKNENKIIIFSKFNKVLQKMVKSLKKARIRSELVTGSFEQSERNIKITRFRNDINCKVLAINLAVGSEGLTLTEANNVIFLNEAWNPSMNRQAEDRVNRLGQRKPVKIHIIRSLGTIDIGLEAILDNKYSLESEYIDQLINEIINDN